MTVIDIGAGGGGAEKTASPAHFLLSGKSHLKRGKKICIENVMSFKFLLI